MTGTAVEAWPIGLLPGQEKSPFQVQLQKLPTTPYASNETPYRYISLACVLTV